MIVSAADILRDIGVQKAAARVKKPSVVKHGTDSYYTMNKCRCDECRRAHNRKQTSRRRSRRGTPPPPHVEHGRENTYAYWCCRCVPCTEAHREAQARYPRHGKKRGVES